MLKKLFFLFSFFIFSSNLFPQSPVVQQILNSVNQDSIIKFVRELSGNIPTIINGTSQTILSRNKNQPGNALAETYIKQKLQNYGMTTTIQSFSTTGKNVLGVKTGTEFPNKKYIICAHFDDMPSGTLAPGADDNGSGTAAVIEAARIFSQYSFPFTIVYALWDEEEQGLVGSEYYATQAANAGDSILGVINMDMIAYDGNNDGNADVHTSSIANTSSLKDKMLEVNLVYGINLDLDVVPAQPYSDHQSFLDHGYGAILLIEDDNDFHPQYHTVNDNLSYYNQPYYIKMSKLSFGTLASFALNLNLDIIHTPIASMTTSQLITTTAFVSSGLQVGTGSLAPRLYYRTRISGGTFGNFIEVTGTPTESGNYTFSIPALPLGTVCQYYVAAQDANSSIVKTLPTGGGGFNPPGSTPPSTFYQFFVAPLTVAMYDEANNITNWTSTSGWNITTAKYVSAPSSFTDSPGGNYLASVTSSLRYNNQIPLTNVLGAVLEFDTQWSIETDYDYGQIQLSTNNGTTWISLTGQYTNPGTGTFQPTGEPLYDGTQSTWVHESINISAYASQQIALRFYFRSDVSVQQDGWYVDNVKVSVYEGSAPTTFPLSVAVTESWNMVSIPGLHPTNQNVSTWWPNRNLLADVFKWTTTYEPVTLTAPTQGYWMLHNGAQTYNYPAIQIVAHDPIPLTAGWNMIGGYENTPLVSGLTTTPTNLIVTGTVYGWNGTYFNPTNLVPGYGYWVLSNGNGVINPPTVADGSAKLVAQDDKSEWGKITITDASGKSYTLYSVNGEVNLDQYQMPPLPPTGMFDVRYGSNRKAEKLDKETQAIQMQGITFPVKIRVEKANIRIKDESGRIINEGLRSGEEVIISNSSINKLMVSGEMIPTVYALEQNYPNPFNPSTKIEFSIPEDVNNVTLTIYNTLGQKVAELVNSKMEAGKYSYVWNVPQSGIATGLYIYELRTDKFVSVKKMMLLK